uniref:Putative tubulin polyglutamylase ttll4 n=1 Tax=Corethrella appendiculata TaxID=1370023 RepID=U5EQF5_9DIPT
MDIKQNGHPSTQSGNHIKQQQHQTTTTIVRNNTANATVTTTTTTPQHKVTLRRRCRSEGLQMAPIPQKQLQLNGQISEISSPHSPKQQTNSQYLRNKIDSNPAAASYIVDQSFNLNNAIMMTNTTTSTTPSTISKQQQQQQKLLTVTNEQLPNSNNHMLKENMITNGYHHYHNHQDYPNDIEMYKKLRKYGLHVDQMKVHNHPHSHSHQNQRQYNPRNSIFDSNRRKLRARSDSEPQEIYTTASSSSLLSSSASSSTSSSSSLTTNNSNSHTFNERYRCTEEITSLKRTRDTISPSSNSIDNELTACLKESPPLKIFNKTNETIMENDMDEDDDVDTDTNTITEATVSGKFKGTGGGPRLKTTSKATTVVNGFRSSKINRKMNKIKSAPSTNSTLVRNNLNRRSLESPINSAASTSSTISESTNGTTEKQDFDEHSDCGGAVDDDDAELSGGEEEDDDLDDIDGENTGELDDSMTDSEDNYKTHLDALNAAKSPSSLTAKSKAPMNAVECCVNGGFATNAPLQASLFPHVPPYITFASHEEKGPPMPAQIQKILKWKLTIITPIIVRKILLNSGFRLLKKTNDWMGIWGKHMKSPCFKTLKPYQKFNHIPGSFQIGRKDRCWRNLQAQMAKHGKKEFGFMPRTYIIPQDLKILRQMWPRYSQRNCKWIIKPPAAARGTGIKVVNRWSQIPKRKPLIVQRYIERPFLINGSKFDLRLYCLVTSINPLRVYMHTDGLARFASVKYSEKSDTLNDRFMHLTNYSINKLSSNYNANEDATACKGHKWTVKSLWSYLQTQKVNTERLWGALRNLVLRTILAGEGPIHAMSKCNVGSKYNCYELFGIDVILDSELVPWLLEVNISPSLHSSSPLDLHVKGPLVTALLNTSLFQIPPKIPLAEQKEILKEQGLKSPLCYDKRIYATSLSKTERIKHTQFMQREVTREEYLNTILDDLTPDDVRCLIATEDELARCAPLERILPAPNSHKYLNFTENPRYYNRLLDAWETRYSKCRADGIEQLRQFCASKIHLDVAPPTFQRDSNDKLPNEKQQLSPQIHIQIQQTTNSQQQQQQQQNFPPAPPSTPVRQLEQQEISTFNNCTIENVQNSDPNTMTTQQQTIILDSMNQSQQQQQQQNEINLKMCKENLIPSTNEKIILSDSSALLLKQQECCEDTENAAIIIQQ